MRHAEYAARFLERLLASRTIPRNTLYARKRANDDRKDLMSTYPIGQFTTAHAEALTGRIADITEIDRDTGRTSTYHGAYVLGLPPSRGSLCLVVNAAEAPCRDPALTGVAPLNILLYDVHEVTGVLAQYAGGWRPAPAASTA
jgi:hypothetical protein